MLLADTSVPVWHEAREELPLLFAAGAAASAGGVAVALGATSPSAQRLALSGGITELAAARAMERRLGWLGQPYHEGRAGQLRRWGTAMTSTGVGLVGAARRHPVLRRLGGALIAAGAAVERFTVVEAGRQSARDPKYTVGPQRTRIDERNYRAHHVSREVGSD